MRQQYYPLISVSSLLDSYDTPGTIIFDCTFYLDDEFKGRKEYLEGHIPGAVYLHLTHDLSSPVIKGVTGRHPLPHPEVLAATLRASGVNNSSTIIVYDQAAGAYAARLWWLIRWMGHDEVYVLDGGIKAWKNEKGPLDNEWPLPLPGNFQYQLRPEFVITMDEIDPEKSPLVDSRDYKRYTGEFEPIDPVAGHIPGAICFPFADNTDSSGMWKSKEALNERFSEISTQDPPPVFYCGSGVTACHNILAYKIATGVDARLYAGSWSEWINYHAP